MIIARAVLGAVADQFGLDWYAIDRRSGDAGQGEIGGLRSADAACGVPPQRPAAQPLIMSSARSMALNTWLGRKGLGRRPSGRAASARLLVSALTSPDRKIDGMSKCSRSRQAISMPSTAPFRRMS